MNISLNNISNIKPYNSISAQKLSKYNLSCDSVSFSSNVRTSNKFPQLTNESAISLFEKIEQKSPEKCKILLENKEIVEYCNRDYGIFSSNYGISHEKEIGIIENSIDRLSPEDMEYVFSSLQNRYSDFSSGEYFINGMIILANDLDCYEYMINSPIIKENVVYSSGYSKDLCIYLCRLNPEVANEIRLSSAVEIHKELLRNNNYAEYTSNSDKFKKGSEYAEELSSSLAQNVSEADFKVYRGERSSWTFDSIPLDEKTAKEVRFLAFASLKSRKDLVYPNNKRYSAVAKQSIYDYIKDKKELTLADAMLVCRYGNKKFQDKILEKMNNAVVTDDNFKSFTLSKDFAEDWAKSKTLSKDKTMLSMVSTTTIKAGNQVGYSARSGQYEFILNDNDKQMTFSNAQYDKETNTFYFDSEISALN